MIKYVTAYGMKFIGMYRPIGLGKPENVKLYQMYLVELKVQDKLT